MLASENLFNVSGKTALVTGGASGLGAMITQALVMAGCQVFISSRKLADLQAYAAEMDKIKPGKVIPIAADLSSGEGTINLVEALKVQTDRLDILINNSGCTWGEELEKFPRHAWDKVLNLNVTAMADLTRLCLPLLKSKAAFNAPSRVINIGSIMGTKATPSVTGSVGAYSYTVSKGAVHHLTKLYSNELAPENITVNAIAPGPFPSRIMAFATDTEDKKDQLAQQIPLGRIGEENDMAGTILWLCSRAGAYITGAIIPLDGGMSATP
ncbi:SDR family oxidoreductase [Temperatibacter marinus]|uniref:SDR family oxidoreductase n=1 Tax=Temperatibacter marinus TaxID=1456591 RepID=A0AA52EIP3_9PROT|nr:SDR family oxidoreductase [Temperatibacter marinus]WND03014.1 SDR family oxidoreductase [Temperatibacter marinus]